MANSRRKNQETRVSEDVRSKASDTATKPFQDGDVRAAILELIGTDEDVMNFHRRLGKPGHRDKTTIKR